MCRDYHNHDSCIAAVPLLKNCMMENGSFMPPILWNTKTQSAAQVVAQFTGKVIGHKDGKYFVDVVEVQ